MSAEGEQPEPPTGYRRDGTPYWSKGPAGGSGWGPAKGMRAERHGARSPRVYQRRARELARGLVAEQPWLEGYPEAVAAWAEAEARASLIREWLADRDLLGDDGPVEGMGGAVHWLRVFERTARDARKDLGLDPASEAAVAKARGEAALVSADLDAVRRAGREALSGGETPADGGDGGESR